MIIIVLAIGLIWWFFPSPKIKIKNYPVRGNTVIMLGDSLVEGVGASEGNALPALIGNIIGVPVENFGKSGDTTDDAIARLDTALAFKPDIAIILLGGNDAIHRTSVAVTKANLLKIIKAFQDGGAVTVLLGVRGGLLGDPYNGMFEDIAQSTGSAYVSDVLSGLFGDSRYMSDGIHPNNIGYAKIADRIAPVIESIVVGKY